MKRQKYHFLVLKKFSSGLSFLTLPEQTFGRNPVPAEANVLDAGSSTILARTRKKSKEGDIFFTTTLRQGTRSLVVADIHPIGDADTDVTLSDARTLFESMYPDIKLPERKIQTKKKAKKALSSVRLEPVQSAAMAEPYRRILETTDIPGVELYFLLNKDEAAVIAGFPGFKFQCRLVQLRETLFLLPDGFAGIRARQKNAYLKVTKEQLQLPDLFGAITDTQGNTYIPVKSIR